MKRIDSLITDFTSIKERYTLDMRQIENNVKVINGFLSGIRDVSDRTGLLAINSSIEAARVGTAGKGFSVLAGEIHGLAKSSKDISLQIDDIVKIISETVGESFRFLESEISNSLEELSQTQADLNSISTNLTDKVSDVEDHVKDSDNLSKTVTAQLNNVSVNMQYQDITRQILEHIMGTLYFYRTKLEENDSRMIAQNDKKEKKETIIKQASAFFTIEDEWKLFGLETVPAVPTDRKDHEYKGNVELF
jgi:methyl-accepting chemotaxis protein